MKKKSYKIIAVYLALNLLFEIVAPTVAFALTNGPSQPEMESFEPVGTTEMVDPFSGDFNYNIPLMTVPGPNGGYPINLAYHAGIGMEQEASWVGLGWNINAGEISRQMRGLPDDFDGDLIGKAMYMRPNRTVTVGGTATMEITSADLDKYGISGSLNLIWNNYKGVGFSTGIGIAQKSNGHSNGFLGGLNSNYSSMSGETTLSPSLSYSKMQNDKENVYGLSFSYGSVEGAKSLSFNHTKNVRADFLNSNLEMESQVLSSKSHSAGVSFSSTSYIPHSEMPMGGFSIGTEFQWGADIAFVNPYLSISANYSQNKISQNIIGLKGYGYLNSQNRKVLASESDQELSLMDFNREKDVDLVKDIPSIPVPVFTNDIFFVKGQGVGGAFRPYRSDVGILHDPVITSKNIGGSLGIEIAVGNPIKMGNDITLSFSKGYEGPWRDMNSWSDLSTDFQFKGKNTSTPLFEPAYFRNAGDMTANYDESTSTIQGTNAPFPIKLQFGLNSLDDLNDDSDEAGQPLADVKVSNPGYITQQKLTDRPSRSQMMSYKTCEQLQATGSASKFSDSTVYPLGSFPRNTDVAAVSKPSYSHRNSHIGEVSVINPDGNRYVYGIAAYNKSTIETSFSVTGGGANNAVEGNRLVNYSSTDASPNNDKNDDHFYTYKSLPEYAHSYLLTAIVSPDYVDLTDNGLTEDDYGYYVKFNYSKLVGDYQWRSPFVKANYMDGFHSIKSDDKAGFVYGTKEVWYLNSIETKTHVAEFTLSPRKDGFGAKYQNNGAAGTEGILGSVALQKIDKIDLYSKNDPNYISTPTPIKTVHFDYTYDLCGNVNNNDGSACESQYYPEKDRNENQGKLTLKKVWFTYLNNNKGQLSPYEFDYAERDAGNAIDAITNPDFSSFQMDRWGNYKPTYNDEVPYVDQSSDAASITTTNNNSSVWCLRDVLLPSGGKIHVEYESDDYAYVQDKPAMQMAEILATAKLDGSTLSPSSGDDSGKITGEYLYLFFKLERQPTTEELAETNAQKNIIKPYVENITDMYFKTYQKLKKYYATAGMARDYVNGYAKVDGSGTNGAFTDPDAGTKYGFTTYEGNIVGYVKLAYVNVHDNSALAGLDHTNPLRKAGWQYLKLNRTDLLYPSSTNNNDAPPGAAELLQLANGVIGQFTSQVQLFAGYYNFCIINGYCKSIDINENYPSFIRVNSPDYIKFGGGHRVKSIRIQDTWTQSDDPDTTPDEGETISEYGQEYSYRMPDGKSSGVAEYEPMIGGEEISLRKPVKYSSDYFIVKHDNLYMEEPYCESYYPAASVGYGRVIIKGINHTDDDTQNVTKCVQGITVNEFYTAKDFPVLVTLSNLLHNKFTPDMNIPFVGNISFENHGFSQSYTVETNDMHGKVKSISTYPYGSDLTASAIPAVPVSKTEYIYKTDAPYSSSARNHLNNLVDVLYDDAFYKASNIGLTKEFFIDMRERSNVSLTIGGQLNLEVAYPPPIPTFTFIPAIDYAEALSKSVVGMNIISRNGVLTETRQYSEGAMASTKNLMFDAATGKPLLTTIINNFDAPVYTYDYAAHWAYDGMGAAYKNSGAEFSVTAASGIGTLSVGAPAGYLALGDQVCFSGDDDQYWVTTITATTFTLRDKANVLYAGSGGTMTILRSGRRNQLTASDGKIVSLNNPLSSRVFPLFDAWNQYFSTTYSGGDWSLSVPLSFTDCSGEAFTAQGHLGQEFFTGIPPYCFLGFSLSPTKCGVPMFQFATPLDPTIAYQLSKVGDKVFATTATGVIIEGYCFSDCDCLKECMPDVLHADALELKDNWSYDYTDIDNNQYSSGTPTSTNPYATGEKGIWRAVRTNVYQTDRKRDAVTDIAKNGTYQNFILFDWKSGATNTEWTWTSEVTKYNPYGYEIENKDALLVNSAALYGYDHSVQTAIAHNAGYYETAFDGLEDYRNDSYTTGHGHLNLAFQGEDVVGGISSEAHTGKKSITVEDGELTFSSAVNYFMPTVGKKYLVSAWFKPGTGTPSITFTGATSYSTALGPLIEGWKKLDVVFTPSSTSITVIFDVTGGNGIFKLDDIRIQPFQSTLKTFVYDPQTLWLVAELDNQNYATFYNYDQEGTLVQVKKETVKGIATIKTTRSNVKRKLNP